MEIPATGPDGPAYDRPRAYRLLIHASSGDAYHADEIIRFTFAGGIATYMVSTDALLAAIAYGIEATTKIPISATDPLGSDAIADLLVRLRKIGVTHVLFDSTPADGSYVPIERAIIGFQVGS